MFIATIHGLKYSSLREERNVFPTGQCAPSCCAPTEGEPNNVTSGYKHLAPLGRNPTASTCCTSKLDSSGYSSPNRSWLRDHQRIRLQFSPIKHSGTLDAALLRLRNILLPLNESDLKAHTARLFHFLLLHLRHTLSGKVEPLSDIQHSILWFAVCDWSFQSLLDQSISQQSVTKLRSFERRIRPSRFGCRSRGCAVRGRLRSPKV